MEDALEDAGRNVLRHERGPPSVLLHFRQSRLGAFRPQAQTLDLLRQFGRMADRYLGVARELMQHRCGTIE
jgi:hypothetical protein